MNKKLSQLASLITASLSTEAHAIENNQVIEDTYDIDKISIAPLNEKVSLHLAAHRSHSSHGSHRSHRSSSGGGYPVPRTPVYPSPPPSSSESQTKKSDPLGQQPRPKSSYPPKKKSTLTENLKNPELRKNIIKRMQLTLQFEGLYKGPIDGIMGPKTRKAVLEYKKLKGIPGKSVLDAATLNAFGIKGY